MLVITGLQAQDLGRVVIRNGAASDPEFIVSLNGVRLTNEYSSTVSFDYLDDYNYKVKLLQAGSGKALSFMLKSTPKYISRYVVNRDAYGNYALILESQVLMGSQELQPAAIPPATVAASPTVFVGNPGPQAINDVDYQGMLNAVKKENFETGKLDLAKSLFGTPGQYVSAEQVLGVLKLFSFENNKLAFAKFAYDYTADTQAYYKVYDAFSFSSSKKELSDYINKQNGTKK